MNAQEPPFRPICIRITIAVLGVTTAAFSYFALSCGNTAPFNYLLPVLLLIALFGMRCAAPRIPWLQLLLAVVSVAIIHLVAEYVLPFALVSEKVIEIVCVGCFGAYWVWKGYLPKERNRW